MALFDKPNKKGQNKSKVETLGKDEDKKELPWISATDNPWGIDVLDLRPISITMLSTSKNPQIATNAASYGGEDGRVFWGHMPTVEKRIETNITFSIDKKLHPGVLYNPMQMEQKWAIYFDGRCIYFVRSWFREIFVVAETRQENNLLIIDSIRGTFIGEEEDKETTEAILVFLLISHALNQVVPAPLPSNLKESTYDAGIWSFSMFGNMAHVGVFDETFRAKSSKPLRSHSLLHIAVAKTELEAIEKYIQEGFDINALAGDGLSPMHWAVLSVDSTIKLLALGADVDARSAEGATPLMNAVQSKRVEQIEVLLKSGANINAEDDRGFTALHRAAEMGHAEIVKLLLDNGADKAIVANGYTALSLAEKLERHNIINILKE